MLAFLALNTQERVELPALSDAGGFRASDLDAAARLLRDPRTGDEHPIEPRLLDLVYRVQKQFAAQELRVISGYRTPRVGHSNHGRGRAIDLVVPGASDEDVARFVRGLGFTGVGVYPTSGFVHIDVRERSYFWVDSSAPGKRNRERGVLGDVAAKADADARARGETPVLPYRLDLNVDVPTRLREIEGGGTGAPAEEDDLTEGEGM
jgi:uncharacterized protein YcbK (DUF882 family)